MNTNIPARRENLPTKEAPTGKNPSTTREPTQTEERANLQQPVKEIRDHTTNSNRILTIEADPTKTAGKLEHQEVQKKTKRVT